jgi:hypothetical protein
MSFLNTIKLLFKKQKDLPNVEINENEKEKQINYEYSDFKNFQKIRGSVVRAKWKNIDNFFALKYFNYDETTFCQIVDEVY